MSRLNKSANTKKSTGEIRQTLSSSSRSRLSETFCSCFSDWWALHCLPIHPAMALNILELWPPPLMFTQLLVVNVCTQVFLYK